MQITGTPAQAGPYTFTLQATDSASHVTTAVFTIAVAGPALPAPAVPAWQFLLASPQPDGSYIADIAQAANRALVLRTEPDQSSEASCDLVGDIYPATVIAEMLTDLHVTWQGQILFAGRIGATQDTLDAAGHHLNVTAADYREVLRRRAILPGDTKSWTGTDQSQIAWNLIAGTQARTGGNLGIARGKGRDTGKNRDMTFITGDYIGDDITQIAQLAGGFEWQITPYHAADLRFDVFYPQQGEARGVVLAYGDGRSSSIRRATDPSAFANAVYETGQAPTSGGSVPTPQYIEAGVMEGRWDKVIGTNITQAGALADDAAAQLAAAQILVPAYTVVLRPGTWGGPADIWMGDLVTVQIDSGRLQVNDLLRVVELSFAISPDGLETLTLTIGARPLNLLRHIPRLERRLRYVETR